MIFRYNSDFIVLFFGRVVQILITIFSIRLSTTYLPENELGLVYYIIAIQTFFSLFLINPVGQYFNRQTNRWSSDGVIFQCFVNQGLYIFFISIFALLFLFVLRHLEIIDLSLYLVIITSVLVMVQSLNQTAVPLLNMLGQRRAFVLYNLLTSILCVSFSFIFIIYIGSSALNWFLGIITGTFMTNIFTVMCLRNISKTSCFFKISFIDIRAEFSNFFSFVLPIAFATIFLWFLASGYRVIIQEFYGLEFLAVIGVGLAVASQFFSTTESFLTQFYIPILYKNIETADKHGRIKAYNDYLTAVIPIFISLAIFLTFSIKYIFPFLVAAKYHNLYFFAIYGVWIELFRVLTNALSLASQIERKTSNIVFPYFFGAAILFIGFFFRKQLDDKLIFMNLLILAYFLVFLLMATSMKRFLKYSFPIKHTAKVIIFVCPSFFFFHFVNFNAAANISLETAVYIFIGFVLYVFGIISSLGKLIND